MVFILEATRRYCALPLHHLFPYNRIHLLIGVVNDASWYQPSEKVSRSPQCCSLRSMLVLRTAVSYSLINLAIQRLSIPLTGVRMIPALQQGCDSSARKHVFAGEGQGVEVNIM